MSARPPAFDGTDRLDDPIDPARRFLRVDDFARLMGIGQRTAWRLVCARDPRLEIVRLGSGPRPIVRVRLKDIGGSGNTWQ